MFKNIMNDLYNLFAGRFCVTESTLRMDKCFGAAIDLLLFRRVYKSEKMFKNIMNDLYNLFAGRFCVTESTLRMDKCFGAAIDLYSRQLAKFTNPSIFHLKTKKNKFFSQTVNSMCLCFSF